MMLSHLSSCLPPTDVIRANLSGCLATANRFHSRATTLNIRTYDKKAGGKRQTPTRERASLTSLRRLLTCTSRTDKRCAVVATITVHMTKLAPQEAVLRKTNTAITMATIVRRGIEGRPRSCLVVERYFFNPLAFPSFPLALPEG